MLRPATQRLLDEVQYVRTDNLYHGGEAWRVRLAGIPLGVVFDFSNGVWAGEVHGSGHGGFKTKEEAVAHLLETHRLSIEAEKRYKRSQRKTVVRFPR